VGRFQIAKFGLPLCLFGAALALASLLVMHRTSCPLSDADMAKGANARKPEFVGVARPSPAVAPVKGASRQTQNPTKPSQSSKDVAVTGSIKQPAKIDDPKTGSKKKSVATRQRPKYYARNSWRRDDDWDFYDRYPGPPPGFAFRVYPGW
jgi:hypothetical protein